MRKRSVISLSFYAFSVACVTGVCAAQHPIKPAAAVAASANNGMPTPTFGTTVVIPSGLRGDVYQVRKRTRVIPRFGKVKLKRMGSIWTTTLDMPPRHWRDGFPGVSKRYEWFAIDYTGRFWIDTPGRYRFALLSDDGSKLLIDDTLIIDNDCQHPPDVRAAEVTLSGGVHAIRVGYYQGPRDCVALILAVAGPGEPWRIFSTDEFKPPPNPEDWKYAASEAPAADVHPLSEPLGVAGLLGMLNEVSAQNGGCLAEPVRYCGE